MQFFKKRKERKKREQEMIELGRQFVDQCQAKIDEYFADDKWDEITTNLIATFKVRLDTVYDEPDHAPKDVAMVELDLFKEQIQKVQKQMWNDLQEHLTDEVNIAAETDTLDQLADLMEVATEPRLKALVASAVALYEMKLEEIEQK